MLIADILHSCRDEGIAEAALASIGGTLALEMRAEAGRSGLTLGSLAASLVRDFAGEATERDWRDLKATTRASVVPVLDGLALIVTTMMARRSPARPRVAARPIAAPASAAIAAAACHRL